MRAVRTVLATLALVVGSVVVAAPAAHAAQAYGATFSAFWYGENWPCPSGCTNSWGYSWSNSNLVGISGGPSWNDSGHAAPTTVTYQSVDCTEDTWYVSIDSATATSDGGSNVGVLDISLTRIGSAFLGSAYFTSSSGTGSGYYTLSGVVYPDASTNTVSACIGGARAAAGWNWQGAMVLANA